MATKLEFDYEAWDPKRDQRILRASTDRAHAFVRDDLTILTDQSDANKQLHMDPLITEVSALLAECLDWLRSNEVPASTVKSKVNSARRNNLDHKNRKVEKTLLGLTAFDAPDPKNKTRRLTKEQKPREVR